MIKFIFCLVVLIGLLIAGPYLSGNQGFVHIEVFNYIIEMSAFTFIISALLLFLLLFIVVYLILKLLHIKTAVFSFLLDYKTHKISSDLKASIYALVSENYVEIEKYSRKVLAKQEDDVFAKFIYFQATVNSSDIDNAVKMLESLEQEGFSDEFIKLLRVKMYLQNEDYQSSFNIVSAMRESNTKNILLSKLYYKTLIGLKRYDLIEKHRQEFLKSGVMTNSDYYQYVIARITKEISYLKDPYVIENLYKKLPKDISEHTVAIMALADKLYEIGQKDKALKMFFNLVKKNLNHASIYQSLSHWRSSDQKIIEFLEQERAKLKTDDSIDIDLNIALAHMYVGVKRVEEARDIYSDLLEKYPSKDLYTRYGYCQYIENIK